MAHCEYWISAGSEQFCDLSADSCWCGGNDNRCALKDKSVSAALKDEERITLDDAALRARRRRSDRMAG